jgi:ATP-dependent Clp protease adaptor protein ClpS
MDRKYGTQEDEVQLLDEKELQENQLILYNDDVNTFDWVIESLIKICKHDRLQAEQCSLIVHQNGKCTVKDGAADALKPMKEALVDRGLSATIE